jgi:hypothetical protein
MTACTTLTIEASVTRTHGERVTLSPLSERHVLQLLIQPPDLSPRPVRE